MIYDSETIALFNLSEGHENKGLPGSADSADSAGDQGEVFQSGRPSTSGTLLRMHPGAPIGSLHKS